MKIFDMNKIKFDNVIAATNDMLQHLQRKLIFADIILSINKQLKGGKEK